MERNYRYKEDSSSLTFQFFACHLLFPSLELYSSVHTCTVMLERLIFVLRRVSKASGSREIL